MINEINQYLAVFPFDEKIEIKCKNELETRLMRGVFLIKENACKLMFKNKEVTYERSSHGQPNIINIPLNISPMYNKSDFTIKLKTLKLGKLPPIPEIQVHQNSSHIFIPSIWTIIIYLMAVTIACYVITKYVKARVPTDRREDEPSSTDVNNLPNSAAF